LTFKHRTQYYRHKDKFHNNVEIIKDDTAWKKNLLRKMQRRLDELAEKGCKQNDITWSIEEIESDTDSCDECESCDFN
jgi:hypothetical protein